jgi:phasin family protein
MASRVRKLIKEQREFADEQVQVLRGAPGTLVRRAAAKSARTVKALEKPARVATRAGVRLTTLSQHTLESLLELQLEVITSVLTSAAAQLERVSRSRSLRGAVAGQAEELRAARDRIVADLERVLEILTRAGRGVRSVATGAYEDAVGPETQAPVRRRRKAAKRAVRKAGPKRAVRKAARGR